MFLWEIKTSIPAPSRSRMADGKCSEMSTGAKARSAIPLPPPLKKLPPVRPPISITFQAELLPFHSSPQKTVDNLPKKEYAMVTFGISDSKFQILKHKK